MVGDTAAKGIVRCDSGFFKGSPKPLRVLRFRIILSWRTNFFSGYYICSYISRGVISELSVRASMEHEHFLRDLSIIQIYDLSLLL